MLEFLVDPMTGSALALEASATVGQEIEEGVLCAEGGAMYPVKNGIPRFTVTADADQLQTAESFGFKWRQRDTYASPSLHRLTRDWLVARYGFDDVDALRRFFGTRRRILDAGCGSGFTTTVWMDTGWNDAAEWCGVDISSAIDVARERIGESPRRHFVQADILQLPFAASAFDTVYAEGVLHHTPSTERALGSVTRLLASGGQILFYLYRRKAPIREFSDDYIRGILSRLAPAEAWARLRPLTRLGRALAELHVDVEVPEDIPDLGIRAGRYDVQRLIYWGFLKLYWNEALPFEENNHVNFDWYHPAYAHRHTEEEIRRWCEEAHLSIVHFDRQESGYSVRAVKR